MLNCAGAAAVVTAPIPRSLTGLTPAWATRAISGRHPDATVGSVSVLRVDRGTTTRVVLGLEYAAGGGPHRLFVKLQGGARHRITMGLLDMLYHESRALSMFEPMPLPAPLVYATGVSRPRLQSMVVMEDLTERGVILNDASRVITPDAVAGVLRTMARMHAQFWEVTHLGQPALRNVPTRVFLPGWAR